VVTVSRTGFHEGELAVQAKAGTSREASRLVGMLAPADLDGGAHMFLAKQTFAVLTARDGDGRLWSSPLVGAAGFLDGHATTLDVGAAPRCGDPLAGLPGGQAVGLIAVDFAARRRVRVNGTLVDAGPDRLRIEAEQAYGNCPQYISRRSVRPGRERDDAVDTGAMRGNRLSARQARLVAEADTFFLGTTHPTRGTDASHRGGPVGFVRLEEGGGGLWWPDYPGNNMFNSLGNIEVDPRASLLFVDFVTGESLHLSGVAKVEWDHVGDEGGTGRRVRFTPEQIVAPNVGLSIAR
jgi:uncharacterized protein